MIDRLKLIVLVNLALVFFCLVVAYKFGKDAGGSIDEALPYGLMTAGCALVTFFGLLAHETALDADGQLRSERVRFAMTAMLVVMFVVYFSTAAFWDETEPVSDFVKLMTSSLFSLLSIVVSFYFAATAAVDIFGKKEEQGRQIVKGTPIDGG